MAGDAGVGTARLLAAVTRLRGAVDRTELTLDVPGVDEARTARRRLLDQLDDYVLPRLTSIDAPLLAVVGGSTGAGKSTLVNSLVGHEVSEPGVLRPTTRSPVLIHHPDDASWFSDQRILPGLARLTGSPTATEGAATLRLVGSDALAPGLALLDAPDIDSVVAANRELAAELLSAADLWIFVTTAARYADAVPWELLQEAAERGTSVAVVLDRVPEDVLDEVRDHLAQMLREHDLGEAPLFTVVESVLEEGLLPQAESRAVRDWLEGLATDAQRRAEVVRRTLDGVVRTLPTRARALAAAQRDQNAASERLVQAAREAYADALHRVDDSTRDGTLLRGEVLARWQEYVGTGELFRQVESRVSRLRDRLTSFLRGEPSSTDNLGEALQSGVEALVLNRAEVATSETVRSWRSTSAGLQVLGRDDSLTRPTPGLGPRVERLVRDWQGDILEMVRTQGQDRRTTARVMAYGVNGLGVVLMLVTFASTAGITGAEVGIAGGTAVVGQKLLEAIFGDQAVRDLARAARERLVERVADVYGVEESQYVKAVRDVQDGTVDPKELLAAVAELEAAR